MKNQKTKTEQFVLPKNAQFISLSELEISLPKKMASPTDFAIWVRTLLQGWRQGTVAVKGRSDVARTNKKPWKQKGTGGARAGTARSPLWRGGGVTFGPQERTRTLNVTKQKKKDILLSMLAHRIAENRIIAAESKPFDKPRTKDAQAFINALGLFDQKVLLFLPIEDEAMGLSFANLRNVNVVLFDQANAFDLANADYWLVLDKDLGSFKRMVSKWS